MEDQVILTEELLRKGMFRGNVNRIQLELLGLTPFVAGLKPKANWLIRAVVGRAYPREVIVRFLDSVAKDPYAPVVDLVRRKIRQEARKNAPLGATKKERKRNAKSRRLARAKLINTGNPPLSKKKQIIGTLYEYRERNLLLKFMGYQTYANYLASKQWWVIRNRVIVRDKGRCQICPRPADQVHHLDYSPATLTGDNDSALVSLCGHCHGKIEFDCKGKKCSLSAAQRRYQELKGMR